MFNKPSISDYYKKSLDSIKGEILRESEEQIIGSDIDQLAEYYFYQHTLSPIEVDESEEANWSQENYVKTIRAEERDPFFRQEGSIDFPCQRIRVEIPLKPNDKINLISSLSSSTISLSYSDSNFSWNFDSVSFTIETKGYGFNYDEDQITREVEKGVNNINQIIGWKNNDIKSENIKLLNQIKQILEVRKREIESNNQKMSNLTKKISIPLKKKESNSSRRIHIEEKPIVRRVKPSPQLPEEYVLDESKVNDIIEIIDNQADTFEKTPRSFESLGEEDLRNIICANLNSIFKGNATGETFSKKGKTDIYLNIEKGNILIFECKIWKGKEEYLKAINQLRGYLTWRQNYGVIISFVKVKNFTQVVNKIEDIVKSSESYLTGFKRIKDTRFVSTHNLEDEDKQVKILHLFYNLYT